MATGELLADLIPDPPCHEGDHAFHPVGHPKRLRAAVHSRTMSATVPSNEGELRIDPTLDVCSAMASNSSVRANEARRNGLYGVSGPVPVGEDRSFNCAWTKFTHSRTAMSLPPRRPISSHHSMNGKTPP